MTSSKYMGSTLHEPYICKLIKSLIKQQKIQILWDVTSCQLIIYRNTNVGTLNILTF
jgi:hypothetical protein